MHYVNNCLHRYTSICVRRVGMMWKHVGRIYVQLQESKALDVCGKVMGPGGLVFCLNIWHPMASLISMFPIVCIISFH